MIFLINIYLQYRILKLWEIVYKHFLDPIAPLSAMKLSSITNN